MTKAAEVYLDDLIVFGTTEDEILTNFEALAIASLSNSRIKRTSLLPNSSLSSEALKGSDYRTNSPWYWKSTQMF